MKRKTLFLTGALLIAGAATIGTHYASSTNDLLAANVEALSDGEVVEPSYNYILENVRGTEQVACEKNGELYVFNLKLVGMYAKGKTYSVNYERTVCSYAQNSSCDFSHQVIFIRSVM